MSAVVNRVRRTFYMDSVALMRISRAVSSLAGVETAALMIGSTTNKKLMRDAGLLNATATAPAPTISLSPFGPTTRARLEAIKEAEKLLDAPAVSGGGVQRMESENAGDRAAAASAAPTRADLGAR